MGDFKRARQRAKEIRKGVPPEQSEILSQTEKDTQETYPRREAIINDMRRGVHRTRVINAKKALKRNKKKKQGLVAMKDGLLPPSHGSELELGDEFLDLADAGLAPAQKPARPLRTDVYVSTDRHTKELSAISTRPTAAAHSGEVAEPGDFVTVEVAGIPLIVTRGQDNNVHAMHNICAHRGATVETREAGSERVLSCPFHGWSYHLDGELRAVSDASAFSSTPCTREGLTPVHCEERHGIIWVTADHAAAPIKVRDWLGDKLDNLLTSLKLDSMVLHAATIIDVNANWKLLTDGFLELYHFKYLHRNTVASYLAANIARPLRFGEHLGNAIPKEGLLKNLDDEPREEWRVYNGTVIPVVLLPGTVINWDAGHLEVFSLRPNPKHPGQTLVRLWLAVPAKHADQTDLWNRTFASVLEVINEDFVAAEHVQRNIEVGVTEELLIGANEELLIEHMASVDQLVANHGSL